MVAVRTLKRAALIFLLSCGAAVWYACSERVSNPLTGPSAPPPPPPAPDLRRAVLAQERHTEDLLRIPGVVGTAVGLLPDGRVGVQLLLEREDIDGLPFTVDGVPVTVQVTGRLMAFSDPTTRQRPAPLGFSVGHPAITAGTIGARVRDATGRVYILSNNHVLANSNGATVGDAAIQPGPFDGGTAADQIATLSDFQTITFSPTASNLMDAAIAQSSTDVLSNATPTDDAYGLPSSVIHGDTNGDGLIDDRNALLGLNVQKYGRTTRLTHGQISGVNATVSICYEVTGIFCTKAARFVDQLIITPGGFSAGGDSGSLIVTDDENKNPVALLFAGSATQTIASRIDLVLNRFGVTIDGAEPPPTGPLTDLAITNVGSPPQVVLNVATDVTVTVRNFGNQDVPAFDVVLEDTTEHVTVGTQGVSALAPGASTTLTFSWTPASNGNHTLVGRHTLTDDKPINDQASTTVGVSPPLTDISVTGVTAPATVSQGRTINVTVTVANAGNQNVRGSFDLTLHDATDNVTIGTQTVSGLNVGATATRTFAWTATDATLGTHTLVATQGLADDNAANDQRSATVTVTPKVTDLTVSAITGPPSVTQGATASIGVTVQNVGELDVTASFDVVLTDASTSITIGTQAVNGLALGASTTLTFPWNTTGFATGGHILIARQMLADDNLNNNARAIGVTVNPPVNPPIDISVTAVTAPASVTQGNNASIGVTVQNVGQQPVGASFDVVLTDATAGATIGTQTVPGLAVGASTTLTFNWTTTTASLGNHSLVATHSFTDDNASNNQRSVTVAVTAQPVDVAITSLTAPSSVTQGNTANIGVTVQNVGQQNVTGSFDVLVRDASTGITIGTQALAGLAIGASSTLTFPWNTTGVATGGHILIASHTLGDDNTLNNARAVAVTVNPPVTLVTDLSVTSVTAPASVGQGQNASVVVTVGNVGNLASGSFSVTLLDATDNVTVSTQSVSPLGVGASATLTFNWATTSASVGTHTLVASHNLADDNAANNQRSATVTVTPRVTDVSVTSINAPASVKQGNSASIGVTVQNTGQENVGASFNVVLTDATGGTTIGSQTVTGLAVGASSTVSFNWNTGSAALGGHTIVATHTLMDDNAANNQRSATVTVTPRLIDVALTSVTGPASVSQGATASIGITVQNVGEQDVAGSFDVVLTDASTGITIGTQAVAGLALGASASLTIPWNTTGAATGGHILMARHLLADDNTSNNARAVAVNVTPPSVHAGNLTGTTSNGGNTWSATVAVTVHDANHVPVSGAVVRGAWSLSNPTSLECTSAADGTCSVLYSSIAKSAKWVSFSVSSITRSGYSYQAGANHDPDGSSNGTTISVNKP